MNARPTPLRHATLVIDDGVAVFTHQRPEARNALSAELLEDYSDMLDAVEGDSGVRVLVLTGSGGSFCAGGDLKSLKAARAQPPDAIRRRVMNAHGWLQRLRNLEMPVIAAVDGAAIGAGFSIALAADFILASSRALFSLSFARVGLVPDLGAAYILPRLVGLAVAKELVLTARRVDANEAKQLGIVHAIHSPEALAEEAHAFARRFVAGPREAMGFSKRLLNMSFESPYPLLAELEGATQALASSLAYHTAAVTAFLEGQPPAYDWDRQRGA
ncbi:MULTISPECIES: enoyl-CoA hydratase/isomerase family protein [unclassified Paraburkholderia]|uniref:enoyl-CoA hydratase/isomerase family protein n=1 Tax=unclassified Paraburkholderia TaxID=2615204 RepID=UPI002AB611D1|nr:MULTISPECIES: enoyl-CoA hydratase/isomerase family protein [unclassified Paraburkholderia]